MRNFSFLKNVFFAVAAVALVVSCDDKYDLLGSDVVDGDLHNSIVVTDAGVTAYDTPIGEIQTNNSTSNLLGSYNSVFGRVTASYVTQVQLASPNPSFTNNITIDSVWVYVPFATTQTGSETNSTTNETDNLYTINGYYGKLTDKFRLRITENNYFIRGGDAATGGVDPQYYYSDDTPAFAAQQGQSLLARGNDTIISFSDKEIKRRAKYRATDAAVTDSTAVIAERLAPGLFFYLNKNFFKNKVLDPSKSSQLSTNAAFAEYFRGVSFWAEAYNGGSTMLLPNFTNGYIKVVYNQDVYNNGKPVYEVDANGNATTTIKRTHLTMTINLKGNHVNLFETQNTAEYLAGVTSSDATNGDSSLYLRGMAGSMALLDIFPDAQRTALVNQKALINDARLRFYVDQSVPYDSIPHRIYLYDVTNKRPLFDYSTDGTTAASTKNNKYIYGGIYDAVNKCYVIRLTNHISNLVKYADSTNVKLGLVLTDDITVSTNRLLKTPFTAGATTVKTTPTSNTVTPLGVKLYGPNIPASDEENYDKRLRLEIFYTKPDEN